MTYLNSQLPSSKISFLAVICITTNFTLECSEKLPPTLFSPEALEQQKLGSLIDKIPPHVTDLENSLKKLQESYTSVITWKKLEKASLAQTDQINPLSESGNHSLMDIQASSRESFEFITHSLTEIENLKEIIENINHFTTSDLELREFDLNTLLANLSRMIPIKNPNLLNPVEVDQDVPVTVISDQVKITHILRNLIANAIKFTDTGSVTIRVKRAPRTSQEEAIQTNQLMFEVIDTGKGLSQEDSAKLFQPYTQTEEGKNHGGTGLGLDLSRRFSALLGGKIGVRSNRDTKQANDLPQTTFWFTSNIFPCSSLTKYTSISNYAQSISSLDSQQDSSQVEAYIAHELRNVLSTVSFLIDLEEKSTQDLSFNDVKRSVQAILEILNGAIRSGKEGHERNILSIDYPRIPINLAEKRIIIADDSPGPLKMVASYVSRMGVGTIDTAESAGILSTKMKENDYDMAITDMNFPDGEGIEVIKTLQQVFRDGGREFPLVVGISGKEISETDRPYMDASLLKPATQKEIHDTILDQFNKRSPKSSAFPLAQIRDSKEL